MAEAKKESSIICADKEERVDGPIILFLFLYRTVIKWALVWDLAVFLDYSR